MRHRSPSLDALIRRQEAQQEAACQARDRENAPPKPLPRVPNTDRTNYRADPLVIPIDPKVAAHQFPDGPPPPVVNFWKTKSERPPSTTVRPKRMRCVDDRFNDRMRYKSKKPLPDPCTYEMARLYAWTYYRMQKLDLQLQQEIEAKQAEINALKRELHGEQKEAPQAVASVKTPPVQEETPQAEPRAARPQAKPFPSLQSLRKAKKALRRRRKEAGWEALEGHAHADVSMAPGMGSDGSPGDGLGSAPGNIVGVNSNEEEADANEDNANERRPSERGPP